MLVELSNSEYRKSEGISSTDIKAMCRSFAHYKHMKDNPDTNDSPALLFGRAYHKFCLEPYDFDNEFIVSPKFDRRTKAGKEAYEQFLKDAEGKDVIDEEMMQTISDMRDALYATPFCKKLIYGEHEKSIFWEREDGLKMKCRPDSYGKLGIQYICVDLKTTEDAETEAFMRSAIKYGYDIQASHYCEGLKAEFGDDFKFVFIAQEKKPPYAVNILEADEMFMRSGDEVREDLLSTYLKCLEKNEFPAYLGFSDEFEINSLGLPSWMKKAFESEE